MYLLLSNCEKKIAHAINDINPTVSAVPKIVGICACISFHLSELPNNLEVVTKKVTYKAIAKTAPPIGI